MIGYFYIPYFNPTIDFNMLSSSGSEVTNSLEVSNHFSNLLAGLLVDFKDFIVSRISRHSYYAYHFLVIILQGS